MRRDRQDVQLKPKTVQINEIELISFAQDKMQITIREVCGKGTYIRALARDFGRAINSGAYLTALRRTRVGEIKVDDCVNYDKFEAWLNTQTIENEEK